MKRGSMRTISNSSRTRAVTAAPRRSLCSSMTSRNWSSTRATGLSAFMLLWKTVEMSFQRSGRRASWSRSVMSRPSKTIRPPLIRPGRSSRRSSAVPSVVLPEPDSPMTPTNSPSRSENDTSRTASTARPRRGS